MGTTISRHRYLTIHANAAFIAAIRACPAQVGWWGSCWRAVDVAEHYERLYR